MVYSEETKNGKYYLHKKGNLMWFSPKINKDYAIDEVPEGYQVTENSKTGLPFVKKRK